MASGAAALAAAGGLAFRAAGWRRIAGWATQTQDSKTVAATRRGICAWANFSSESGRHSAGRGYCFGRPIEHGQGKQQHPAQAQFAVLCGIPFGLGMRAPPPSPPAPRTARELGERAGILASVDPRRMVVLMFEAPVHGAQRLQERGIVGQQRGRAVPDLCDLESDAAAPRRREGFGLGVGEFNRIFDGAVQRHLKPQQLIGCWWTGSRWLPTAFSGIELTLVPPRIVPRFRVVRGSSGMGVRAKVASAMARAAMGLGVPASVKLWPPGPPNRIWKRRLPSA